MADRKRIEKQAKKARKKLLKAYVKSNRGDNLRPVHRASDCSSGIRLGRESRNAQAYAGVSEVEDMLTVRMRQLHPGIARIGIEHGPTGWKAYRVWLLKSEQMPSDEVLAEAESDTRPPPETLRDRQKMSSCRSAPDLNAGTFTRLGRLLTMERAWNRTFITAAIVAAIGGPICVIVLLWTMG